MHDILQMFTNLRAQILASQVSLMALVFDCYQLAFVAYFLGIFNRSNVFLILPWAVWGFLMLILVKPLGKQVDISFMT